MILNIYVKMLRTDGVSIILYFFVYPNTLAGIFMCPSLGAADDILIDTTAYFR